MDIIVHGFSEYGDIEATIDSVRLLIPNDMGNSDRIKIKEWEKAGNIIPPFSKLDEKRLKNLEPDQFWFILRVSGYEEPLKNWIANLNDPENENYNPVEWAQVSSKLEFAKFFERENPMIEYARQALGITSEELDSLWIYGQG